ncbi:hypothetical protein RJT34_21946 [Clitoria ternatea]|uniref:TIR domain-containing protein n=1 Tax=Clitoria ternatea TaxID=43366 RepID=A0AAN9IUR8_CLITE
MSSSTRFWFRPSWNPQWHYDVFISFSGYDWRDNLVSYLYSALSRAGVKSFVDGKFQPGRGLDPEGIKAIEGLALKLERQSKVCFDTKVFEKLERLRLLKLNHVELVGDYKYLPQHLRWVNWQGFSLKHMPNNFDQRNVIAIDLKYSNINLIWKEPQLLERLKFLNLSHSSKLKHTPDFSKLPNLVKLILKHCTALTELHQSIGNLNSILVINLMGCTSLSNLPRTTYQLKSLKILILSGCSMIDKLEEDIGQMESLTTLIANDTAVKEMPRSIVRSKNIGYISLCGYEGVARDVFPSVIRSWMSPTINFHSPIHQSWSISSSLVSIDVQSNNLSNLTPMLSNSSKLRSVSVRCYSKVQLNEELRRIVDNIYDVNFTELETTSYASQVSNLSLRSLLIGMGSYHIVMDTLGKSILQGLTMGVSVELLLPGDNYPYWLTHSCAGRSVMFKGIISNLEPGDEVGIFVVLGKGFTVKKAAVYLLCDESIDMST